jgi:hypothetical protein
MPNTTGSESVHSAMQKASGKKMIGLVEACESDQNRAASQIAAYTAYLKGCHRGKGPTLWELAYRNADTIGSLKGYASASNMFLSNEPSFNLHRTGPLHGDLRTQSVKRKMNFGFGIGPQDSHRHDRVLRTSPNPKGFCKNVETDFAHSGRTPQFLPPSSIQTPRPSSSPDSPQPSKAASAAVTLSSSSDDVEILEPVRRPATRSQATMPDSIPHAENVQHRPLYAITEVPIQVRSWHLRRSTNRGAGPTCNGSLKNTSASRDLCKNRINAVGFPDRRGVVGIMIGGE